MKKVQLLISGIPGSGKSSFSRWLHKSKGFTHVDMENDGLDKHSFRNSWEAYRKNSDDYSFVTAIRSHPNSVVLDWGFPPSCWPLVLRLKESRIPVWWFDGDRLTARSHFIRRRTVPVSEFDCQFAQISLAWPQLELIIGSNIVKVIHTDGTFSSCETIYERILGNLV
jgi:hypothetical protein